MKTDLMDAETNPLTERRNLDRLLRPRSVALVGISATAGSLGECVLTNLESSGYTGDICIVNPKRPVIHGRQSIASIDELPDGIDCAVLAVPGTAALPSVRACAAKRFGSVIVFSAGFGEAGDDGRAAQEELARIARDHNMIIEGPNCLGMVNYLDGIPLTFVMTPPQPSPEIAGAAILSQSGALAAVIAVNMRHHRIPLTYSVSTGNEAANGVEDFLEHLIGDERTRVFALIVEQFRQPQRFLALARRARRSGQLIALLHPGHSKEARASAATHTGAIAGDYQVMHTLVTRAGVIHVESMEELVDVTQILVRCRELPAGGTAVFTESGAFKALTLDLCNRIGLHLPALSPRAEQALRQALPPFIPPSNPLDLTAQGLVDPDLYRRTLPPVLDDDGFGSVMLGIILTDAGTTRLKLPPIVDALTTLRPDKPVIFAALDEGAPFDFPELEQLRALGVPCFPSPERALRAIGRISARRISIEQNHAEALANAPIHADHAGVLSEFESKRLLSQLGIPVPAGDLARTVDDALSIAADTGYPIALKAQSPHLPHKSDAGGVLLNINSDDALRTAWDKLHNNVRSANPGLELDGILVEHMGDQGVELIVGARNDPQWGPVLLVGFGGVLAEAVDDVRLLAPDLSVEEIECELHRLRCSALLRGFRGAPALDVSALANIIATLGRWMRSEPRLLEIDINPVVVYAQGKGASALDALISLAPESDSRMGKEGQAQ
ncbi:acetate--CoA ligase family protein [Occallatibacter riparius]|uniref:Acetate--CoA ligase family protein n=1 Tax=Occallatibacter riparius TaxID=1002689 RepID=A0A9J7BUY4_9BACT|nr:acetate--CoA ligase family protein [Occallatibacter riparius]UWZ85578.1 acetate--CoA ligase family protein [Occallatibacter riparius]